MILCVFALGLDVDGNDTSKEQNHNKQVGPTGPTCFPPALGRFYPQHAPNNPAIRDQNKPQRYNNIEDTGYGELIFQEACVHTGAFNQGRHLRHEIIHPVVAAERQLENQDGLNCGLHETTDPGQSC